MHNSNSNHSKGTISGSREKGAEEQELKPNHTTTKRRVNLTNSTRLQKAEIVARKKRYRNFTSTNTKRSQTETNIKHKMKTLNSDRGKRLLRPPTLTHGHSHPKLSHLPTEEWPPPRKRRPEDRTTTTQITHQKHTASRKRK
ncbi:Uncharacterized protein Rs2_35455 [Raphanus sativus]|nr:Uncharacterized protein Rs2_35455 [Raphanus sativus]